MSCMLHFYILKWYLEASMLNLMCMICIIVFAKVELPCNSWSTFDLIKLKSSLFNVFTCYTIFDMVVIAYHSHLNTVNLIYFPSDVTHYVPLHHFPSMQLHFILLYLFIESNISAQAHYAKAKEEDNTVNFILSNPSRWPSPTCIMISLTLGFLTAKTWDKCSHITQSWS